MCKEFILIGYKSFFPLFIYLFIVFVYECQQLHRRCSHYENIIFLNFVFFWQQSNFKMIYLVHLHETAYLILSTIIIIMHLNLFSSIALPLT